MSVRYCLEIPNSFGESSVGLFALDTAHDLEQFVDGSRLVRHLAYLSSWHLEDEKLGDFACFRNWAAVLAAFVKAIGDVRTRYRAESVTSNFLNS
jgi:hypothetical protein